MNKAKLVESIIKKLETDLAALKAAALETYAAAIGEESKPENEYDTRAVEASYLAGAQAQRVVEIEAALGIYKTMKPRPFDDTTPIAATAYVELELNGKTIFVFVVPVKGGISLSFEGKPIQVVAVGSPLGSALLSLKCGDTALVEAGGRSLDYDIISVE